METGMAPARLRRDIGQVGNLAQDRDRQEPGEGRQIRPMDRRSVGAWMVQNRPDHWEAGMKSGLHGKHSVVQRAEP